MDDTDPADFYTGIVADVYGPLRGSVFDPRRYAAFVGACGEPALELGCGDGHPLLMLRAGGLDVEGVDSSADMLSRLRAAAADLGLDVSLHHTRSSRWISVRPTGRSSSPGRRSTSLPMM